MTLDGVLASALGQEQRKHWWQSVQFRAVGAGRAVGAVGAGRTVGAVGAGRTVGAVGAGRTVGAVGLSDAIDVSQQTSTGPALLAPVERNHPPSESPQPPSPSSPPLCRPTPFAAPMAHVSDHCKRYLWAPPAGIGGAGACCLLPWF